MFIFTLYATTHLAVATPPKINMEDAFAELNGTLVLHFKDAKTGNPVSNATIKFDNQLQTTDSNGTITVPFPTVGVGETVLYAQFDKAGFISAKLPVTFMAGTIWNHNFSVSESIQVDQLRIVVDWSDKPSDLDAHLIKHDGYHISYRIMKNYKDIAILDRDDRDGNGPETITVQEFDANGQYSYIVHDYSNRANKKSNKLSQSRGQVLVYSNNGLEAHYRISENNIGTVWNVFDIKQGQIVDVNKLTTDLPN